MQCTLLVDVVAALYTILGLEAVVFCILHDDEQMPRRQTLKLVLKVFLLFLRKSGVASTLAMLLLGLQQKVQQVHAK